MELKITKIDDSVKVECFCGAPENEQMGYSEIVGMLMSALDGATKTILKELNEEQKAALYDRLDAVFGNFLSQRFPEIDPEEFTLIDAAIVKAQDEIINDAFDRGITLDEALQEYHDKAVEYIKQRRIN